MVEQQRLGKHRHLGRTKGHFTVMAQNQVEQQIAQLGREVRYLSELRGYYAHTNVDVSDQLSFVAVAESTSIVKLPDLADVVQEDARKQQIEVDVFIMRGGETRQVAQ